MTCSYFLCAFVNSNSDCAFLSRHQSRAGAVTGLPRRRLLLSSAARSSFSSVLSCADNSFQFQQSILTERRKPPIGLTPDSVAGVTPDCCPGQSPGLGRKWESRKQKAEIPIRAFSAQRFGGHRGSELNSFRPRFSSLSLEKNCDRAVGLFRPPVGSCTLAMTSLYAQIAFVSPYEQQPVRHALCVGGHPGAQLGRGEHG